MTTVVSVIRVSLDSVNCFITALYIAICEQYVHYVMCNVDRLAPCWFSLPSLFISGD